jgi:N-acetylneuraminate synthase
MSHRCRILAEAGVNHNGSPALAHQLIDAAAAAGADAVKFQTFSTPLLLTRAASKAPYQKRTTGAGESQYDMVKKLELPPSVFGELAAHCRDKGIQFLSTAFDLPSLELLLSIGVSSLKLPSGELTNPFLLDAAARSGKPILVSTGMATLGEVEEALAVLAAGYTATDDWQAAYLSEAGRAALREKVTLLHCTTEYPAQPRDVNLHAMSTLGAAFGLPIGYSDHTLGITVAVAARALGATVIEKHFTLDRALPGPDHHASLLPDELGALVRAVREVEDALGSHLKGPTPPELANRAIARRSLVAARPIRRGEPFTLENVTVKRPGDGISPMRYREWLGRLAERDYAEEELLGR